MGLTSMPREVILVRITTPIGLTTESNHVRAGCRTLLGGYVWRKRRGRAANTVAHVFAVLTRRWLGMNVFLRKIMRPRAQPACMRAFN